jgi:hypothetical protein
MTPMNQQNMNFMKNNPMNPQQMQQQQQQQHQQQQQQQQQGGQMNNQMNMMPGGNNGGGFPSSCDINADMGMWANSGNQQMGLDPSSLDPLLNDPIDSLVNDPLTPNSLANLQHQGPMGGQNTSCMDPTSPSIPSLQGVKVPDEDLTPQQRQQRALKLAQLQELKQMFKQEHPTLNQNELNALSEAESSLMAGNIVGGPCPNNNKMNPNAMNAMNMHPGPGNNNNVVNNPGGPMNMHPMNNQMNMNGPQMRPNFGQMMPGPPRPNNNNNMNNMCRPPVGPNSMNPGMNPDEMMMAGNGPGGMNSMMCGPNSNMMGGMPSHMQNAGGGNMGMNNMVPGNCMMPGNNPGPMMGGPQKGNMPPGMMGNPGNMHMDWKQMQQQQQYYEDNKRKGPPSMNDMPVNDMNPAAMSGPMRNMPPGAMRNMPPNMRIPSQQGPPPPYHQTPRSASVPIATQSPNPNSPNNPTSNLSLPSPRGGSTLNSPASGDPSRMNPQQFKHMNPRQSPTTSSQDSPAGAIGRQINHSNPSTPISSHLSPSASLKDLEMSTNPSKCSSSLFLY